VRSRQRQAVVFFYVVTAAWLLAIISIQVLAVNK